MMHVPDCWVVIKTINWCPAAGTVPCFYKVLAGWNGVSHWRLNSGITRAEISEDRSGWLFHGASGAVYLCDARGYRLNRTTSEIWHGIACRALTPDVHVEIMPEHTLWHELDYELDSEQL